MAATRLRPAPCVEGVPGAGARKVAAMVTVTGMTASARSTSSYRLPLEMSFIVRHLCSWLQLLAFAKEYMRNHHLDLI